MLLIRPSVASYDIAMTTVPSFSATRGIFFAAVNTSMFRPEQQILDSLVLGLLNQSCLVITISKTGAFSSIWFILCICWQFSCPVVSVFCVISQL